MVCKKCGTLLGKCEKCGTVWCYRCEKNDSCPKCSGSWVMLNKKRRGLQRIFLCFKPDYADWERVNLEFPKQKRLSEECPRQRKENDEETNKDLRKGIQQLVCDVHDEITASRPVEENLALAIRRMVSMMGRVSLTQERGNKILCVLTTILIILTTILIILTVVLLFLR